MKKDRFNFLFCGRLEKFKNVHFTLKCLKNLKAETWEEIAKQYHDFFIKAIEKHKTNTK